MSSSSLPGKSHSSPPLLPQVGSSTTVPAPLPEYPAACKTQREPSPARFKEKFSGKEKPEAEASGVKSQDSLIFLPEAALPAGGRAARGRKPVGPGVHRHPAASGRPPRKPRCRERGGGTGACAEEGWYVFKPLPAA